jgi:hypothetical protein
MVEVPKPPIGTMTDFVVFAFVSIVAILLLVAGIGVGVLAFTDPDRDTSQTVNALADIVTTMIGALIGFIAGKGSGRSEVHDEMIQLEHQKSQQQTPPTP